jgi:DNA-binding beta-propeller fold protein YncE
MRFQSTVCCTALLFAVVAPLGAVHAQIAVSANDHKMVWDNGKTGVAANAPQDNVTVIDLSSTPLRVIGQVVAPVTVAGPPQTVAVAPDESIALVSSGQKLDPTDPSKTVSDNRLSVIDLKIRPPQVLTTLQLGAGAAGVSFNRAGDMAMVANRDEGTVSVLAVRNGTVRLLDTIKVGKPDSQPSHVVFANKDKIALVSRRADHQVTVLAIDGLTVKPTGQDLSVGIGPYAMVAHPSQPMVVVANVGRGTGDTDTLSIIDTGRVPPRVVATLDIGTETPEGLAISPDGRWLAVVAHAGSTKPSSSPFAARNGKVLLYRINGFEFSKVDEAKIGRWSQGAVFSRDGKTLLVQNMVERNIQVFDLTGQRLVDTGSSIPLTGGGAALRTAE